MVDIVRETIDLAGTTYTVPPLTLRQLRSIVPMIASIPTLPPAEALDVSVEIVSTAMTRKYPEMTVDWIYDLEDLTYNMMSEAVNKVARAAGLVPKGEAPAVPGTTQSIGLVSTAA